ADDSYYGNIGLNKIRVNYFADQEMQEDDNPPIGIILCAGHHQQLVKYATAGLAQQILVSKYLINLPSEDALKQIIHAEQLKYNES
uniref:PDDEXK nuclease domain-containing protein n=1 Tax=Acinetobacter sp. TaxID=472 RepID=UPI002FD92EE9